MRVYTILGIPLTRRFDLLYKYVSLHLPQHFLLQTLTQNQCPKFVLNQRRLPPQQNLAYDYIHK